MALDIKICGLKTAQGVAAAVAGSATHIGFIFFEKSPRHVTSQQARALWQPFVGKVTSVAVSVDANDDELDAIVAMMQPSMLQLHGHETPQRVAALKARHGLPVMKALSIREAGDLAAVKPYAGIADRLLLDAKPPKGADLPGGNGVAFDWEMLATLDPAVDYMLSGGISIANLEGAILGTKASGLDVSSGVESAPGIKDVAAITQFLAQARRIERMRPGKAMKGEVA